ncbi:E3 ubiquitin-protein ligase PUB23 [Acorus gramineus]|uniref:U-box domain-containing protein n=1 Tax=Acorus gramineus TaxID=55184 RepID=A0AAV9AGQ9_ACOGR|nr:E3 ubiquitin-protein ligase PUB23 [Acorus gramineus]
MEAISIVDVPPYFLCPISLEIMKDPVTLSTGITYDRDSIERWLFSDNNSTCPVTNQSLSDSSSSADITTPNHTLRRLIQSWCAANASADIQRFPTPKPPVDRSRISTLLHDASVPSTRPNALRDLRSIAAESERNRRCMESAGAGDALVSIIKQETTTMIEDTLLCLLHDLQLSARGMRDVLRRHADLIEVLARVMLARRASDQCRAHATLLLRSAVSAANPNQLTMSAREVFAAVVGVVRDRISAQATKAGLKVLGELCAWGRNRVRAVEAGAVDVLVGIVMEAGEIEGRRVVEMGLVVLEILCGCAEGRAELVGNAAGLAAVGKRVLRVSSVATERGVRILSSIARFSGTKAVLQEMAEVGVVAKLCLVSQVSCDLKTKEKAREILRLHGRVWRNSPCIAPYLLSSYPN